MRKSTLFPEETKRLFIQREALLPDWCYMELTAALESESRLFLTRKK